MSEQTSGGSSKKLSTAEILARARAQAGQKAGEEASATPATPAPASSAKESAPVKAPATPAAASGGGAAASGAKPKSTADILAAARAQATAKAAGASAPAAASSGEAPKPAAAAAGGKPKSTAEILAAARAQTKAGAAAAAVPAEGAAPAAKSAKGAKPAVAAADTSGLSVEQMLAAVRPTGEAVKAPAVVKPAAPPAPLPTKPSAPPKKKGADTEERRGVFAGIAALFATPFALAWWAFGSATAVASLATARFMLPNVLTEPPSKFKVGPASDYDLGTVSTKWVAQFGVWIVHTDQYKGRNLIYALLSVCTHLGCTPSWLEGEQKFKCPCHGSGFYINGVNFEGPAPRPLERVGIRLAEDGNIEVDKSRKFQEEMGQWEDSTSYVEI